MIVHGLYLPISGLNNSLALCAHDAACTHSATVSADTHILNKFISHQVMLQVFCT